MKKIAVGLSVFFLSAAIFAPAEWMIFALVSSLWFAYSFARGYKKIGFVSFALSCIVFLLLQPEYTVAFWLGIAPLLLAATLPSKAPTKKPAGKKPFIKAAIPNPPKKKGSYY